MAGRRKGVFTFDLSHPIKKGVLLKQGAFHKAFKYRFFLVYPGFLVYYDQESRWLLDLTKGGTLGVSQVVNTTKSCDMMILVQSCRLPCSTACACS